MKAELERKRSEAYDKERRLLQAAKAARVEPSLPITQALRDIGAKNEPPRAPPRASPSQPQAPPPKP